MSRLSRALQSRQPAANGNRAAPPANSNCGCPTSYPPISSAVCGPPPLPSSMRRGVLPTILATCDRDVIVQPGRLEEMYVPEFIVWDFLARGVNFSPIAPLQAQGTKGVGPLALTLTLPVTQPLALIAGLIVTVGTNANVTPGNSYLTFAGTFEDGTAFSQDVQWKQGAAGSSDFIQLFSKEIQGGAYPGLVSLNQTPTNMTVTITNAAANTEYSIQTLSPVSDYYYWMLSYWESSAAQRRAA